MYKIILPIIYFLTFINYTIGQENNREDLINSLHNVLLTSTESIDFDSIDSILAEINQQMDSSYIQPLEDLVSEVEAKTPVSRSRKKQPLSQYLHILNVMLLELKMEQKGFSDDRQKFEYLADKIVENLNAHGHSTTEVFYLRQNATKFSSLILERIDSVNEKVKFIFINVLQESKNENIENYVMNKINDYRDQPAIFNRLINLLGYIGNKNSLNFLRKEIHNVNTNETKQFIVYALINMENRIIDVKEKEELKKLTDKYRYLIENKNVTKPNTKSQKDEKFQEAEKNKNFKDRKEHGEDMSNLTKDELLKKISKINIEESLSGNNQLNQDCYEAREIAQILGDKFNVKKELFNNADIKLIDKIVENYLSNFANSENDHDNKMEITLQIQRFGYLAMPTLLQHIGNTDEVHSLFVAQRVIEMKNEEVVDIIIKKAKNAKGFKQKLWYRNILKMMKNTYKPLVPNRIFMDEATTREVYARLVEPAIRELDKEITAMKN